MRNTQRLNRPCETEHAVTVGKGAGLDDHSSEMWWTGLLSRKGEWRKCPIPVSSTWKWNTGRDLFVHKPPGILAPMAHVVCILSS